MRAAFFDVAADGILVYRDPLIGRLDHKERRIQVRLNGRTGVLELRCDGKPQQRFPLNEGPEEACRAAAGAYFSTVAAVRSEGEVLAEAA